MSVGAEIAKRRLELGLTQAQLAERVICGRVFVTQIEGGVKSPSIQMLQRFANALDCKVTDLVKEDA